MYFVSFIILIFFVCVSMVLPLMFFLTKKKIYTHLFYGFWGFMIFLFFIVFIIDFVNSKTSVEAKDIVGKYEINYEMFKGKNANWQYEHFSFEITKNNKFIFFEYFDNGKIKSIHKGDVQFVEGYVSPHLKILNFKPDHQVVEKEPLLVRNNWDFYYVFKSKKFGNMFFRKKKNGIFDILKTKN